MRMLLDFVAEDSGGEARVAAVLPGGIAGLIVRAARVGRGYGGLLDILAAAERVCPSGIRQLSFWPG